MLVILKSNEKNIRKEGAWILSNIAAGTQRQIEYLIERDIISYLGFVIQNDEDDVKKEAIWALCNLTSVKKEDYLTKIVSQDITRIICFCLNSSDPKVLAVCMEALGNLLEAGKTLFFIEGKNTIVSIIDQLGMFDRIEQLQFHPVEVVYEKVNS